MSRRIKIILKAAGAVLLLLGIAAAFVPLFEVHSKYCFYCGRDTLSVRVFGLPVPWSVAGRNIYRDHLVIPAHNHKMIEFNGGRMWAYRGQEFWDEFGWTGRLYRDSLLEGIKRSPELEKEIVAAYLMVDPEDREGAQEFLNAYGKIPNKPEHRTPDPP